jgi:hypothetical protein
MVLLNSASLGMIQLSTIEIFILLILKGILASV